MQVLQLPGAPVLSISKPAYYSFLVPHVFLPYLKVYSNRNINYASPLIVDFSRTAICFRIVQFHKIYIVGVGRFLKIAENCMWKQNGSIEGLNRVASA